MMNDTKTTTRYTKSNNYKKNQPYWTGSLVWQRNRDSNPNKQSQSLSCYRYTIPLCATIIIITDFFDLSRKIYHFFEKN